MILTKFFSWISSLLKDTEAVVTSAPAANQTLQTVVTTPAEIADADLTIAITIVNNIKSAFESPAAVLITSLIPGTVDDTLREELVNDLPAIAAGIANIKNVIDTADKSAQFNDVLSQIQLSPNLDMDAFLHSLAARILQKVSKGGVTWSLAVMSVEYFLKNLFKSTPAAPAAVASPVAEAPVQASPAITAGAPKAIDEPIN